MGKHRICAGATIWCVGSRREVPTKHRQVLGQEITVGILFHLRVFARMQVTDVS